MWRYKIGCKEESFPRVIGDMSWNKASVGWWTDNVFITRVVGPGGCCVVDGLLPRQQHRGWKNDFPPWWFRPIASSLANLEGTNGLSYRSTFFPYRSGVSDSSYSFNSCRRVYLK